MASTGNATDFGDLTTGRTALSCVSSPTRACFAGGQSPSNQNIIDFVEIMMNTKQRIIMLIIAT